MIKVGIRAHDMGRNSAKGLALKAKDYGFQGVQLVFKKALDTDVNLTDLKPIISAFSDMKIMMLGAYFNPVHPDKKVVDEGIQNFKNHLRIARELKAGFVGSETGSLMGSPWGYVKENHEQETLDRVIEIFEDLTEVAKKYNTTIAIEGAYAHVAYSPEKVREVLDKIDSKHIKVTVDLFNYLYFGNYQERMKIFDDCFKYLKDDIVIFHLKDFIVENEQLKQVGLGQGLMDYPTIIKRIKKETPNAYLIFEGVVGDDIATSYRYIENLLKE